MPLQMSRFRSRLAVSLSLAIGTAGLATLLAAQPLIAVRPAAPAIVISVSQIVAAGFTQPVQVTHAGDGSNRLFVVERTGKIRIVKNGTTLTTPFLDLSGKITTVGAERGLLGIAFHPDYDTHGYFYVNYTNGAGDTVIERYTVSGNPDIANPASALTLLTLDQPASNHNGGQLLFSPTDHFLYIGMGDGGGGGDTYNNAQNKNTLLGALLRLDVDHGITYTVPISNPYVGVDGADEIWAIGVRNPWRFSFDRANGDLYIGDVGQDAWEEIDYQAANTPGGLNFGWPCREGTHDYRLTDPCNTIDPAAFTPPIAEYANAGAQIAVTGGFVYRGTQSPNLIGRYFYADYGSGRIWSLHTTGPGTWSTPEIVLESGLRVSSFGEDEQGELYVVDYGGGTIRHITDFNYYVYVPNVHKSQ